LKIPGLAMERRPPLRGRAHGSESYLAAFAPRCM